MKKPKPLNPYQRLLNEIEEHLRSVKYRHTVTGFQLPKDRLGEGWEMASVSAAVIAADKLGYDTMVRIHPGSGDLLIQYVKKAPAAPLHLLPE